MELRNSQNPFMTGNAPTIADCCLIPQLYSVRRFACNLKELRKIREIEQNCFALEAFSSTYPNQFMEIKQEAIAW